MMVSKSLAILLIVMVTCSTADFLGRLCGTDWGKSHFYPDGGSTVRKCIEHCYNGTYKYAGLIFGNECFCQDDFAGYAQCRPGDTRPECNTPNCTTPGRPCFNDPTMICGDTSWYSIYDSASGYHNVVTHEDTLVNQICSQNDAECSWYCDLSDRLYTFQLGSVYGSEVYDINSSYCLSAAHDLRYIPNKNTTVSVARKNVSEDLEGAWRFGIQSSWTNASTKAFTVVYPVNRTYVFADAVLFGFVDMAARVLNCEKYDTASNSDLVFIGEVEDPKYTVNTVTKVPIPQTSLLYCGLNTSDIRFPATYVPVITQPSGNDKITPNRTLVVNEGDSIEFDFDTTGQSGGPWYVEKSGRELVAKTSDSSVVVNRPNAQTKMGGFYHLMNDNKDLVATVRVIITPKGTVFGKCGGFRGVQRQDGTCLCIPPFGNSSDCSNVCNYPKLNGQFGPDCKMNCGASQCKGIMVCGEDPFGCHCTSGWTGDDCTVPCPKGTWGPDCKGHADGCMCIEGDGCGRMTGWCPNGCIPGYYGIDCRNEGGYLIVAPYIEKEGYTDITVGWKGWTNITGNGTLQPDEYYLEYKKCSDPDTAYTSATKQPYGASNYTFDVTGLEQDMCYSFRVNTSVKGLMTPHVSPSVEGNTICGNPDQSPQDLTGTPGDHLIVLSWKWPTASHWNCLKTEMKCNYNCSYFCSSKQELKSFKINDTSQTTYQVPVPGYSTCSFECFLINNGFNKGPSSVIRTIQPKPSPPAPVQMLNAFVSRGSIVTVWEPAEGDEGHILYYQLTIAPPGVIHNVTQHSFEDADVTTGQNYTFTVIPVSEDGSGKGTSKTVHYASTDMTTVIPSTESGGSTVSGSTQESSTSNRLHSTTTAKGSSVVVQNWFVGALLMVLLCLRSTR